MDLAPARLAASLLGGRLIEAKDLGARTAQVARLAISGGRAETAVAKLLPAGSAAFWQNVAGTAFLESAGLGAAVPALLAADPATGLLVLEDLGGGPSLADLLRGSDAEAATAALVAHAELLGAIAAVTAGREAEYRDLRRRLGAPDPEPCRIEPAWADLVVTLARLGVSAPAAAGDEAVRLDDWAYSDAALTAYSVGDTCPDNNRWVAGRLRLFDLDYGSFRHPALDAAYHGVQWPTCWLVGQVPPPVATISRQAYGSRFEVSGHDLARATLWWSLVNLVLLLAGGLEGDRPLGPDGPTLRTMLLWRTAEGARTGSEAGLLPALSGLLARIAAGLAARWPETGPLPAYPAFKS